MYINPGEEGFEPSSARAKTYRLTTWLLPSKIIGKKNKKVLCVLAQRAEALASPSDSAFHTAIAESGGLAFH